MSLDAAKLGVRLITKIANFSHSQLWLSAVLTLNAVELSCETAAVLQITYISPGASAGGRRFSPTWHCVVGKSFANYTSYEAKHHIFFEVAAQPAAVFGVRTESAEKAAFTFALSLFF